MRKIVMLCLVVATFMLFVSPLWAGQQEQAKNHESANHKAFCKALDKLFAEGYH